MPGGAVCMLNFRRTTAILTPALRIQLLHVLSASGTARFTHFGSHHGLALQLLVSPRLDFVQDAKCEPPETFFSLNVPPQPLSGHAQISTSPPGCPIASTQSCMHCQHLKSPRPVPAAGPDGGGGGSLKHFGHICETFFVSVLVQVKT